MAEDFELVVKTCDETGMCAALQGRAHPAGFGGVGFRSIATVNIKAKVKVAKIEWAGVGYYTSRKDRGLLLNFCPFCGGRPGRLANRK